MRTMFVVRVCVRASFCVRFATHEILKGEDGDVGALDWPGMCHDPQHGKELW